MNISKLIVIYGHHINIKKQRSLFSPSLNFCSLIISYTIPDYTFNLIFFVDQYTKHRIPTLVTNNLFYVFYLILYKLEINRKI